MKKRGGWAKHDVVWRETFYFRARKQLFLVFVKNPKINKSLGKKIVRSRLKVAPHAIFFSSTCFHHDNNKRKRKREMRDKYGNFVHIFTFDGTFFTKSIFIGWENSVMRFASRGGKKKDWKSLNKIKACVEKKNEGKYWK